MRSGWPLSRRTVRMLESASAPFSATRQRNANGAMECFVRIATATFAHFVAATFRSPWRA